MSQILRNHFCQISNSFFEILISTYFLLNIWFQIVETKRAFTYDADGKLLTVSEHEEQQGNYDYEMTYDDMGNRTSYTKSRNGKVVESGEYTYNLSNQLVSAKLYDGKKHTTMEYTYDADGNLIAEDGTDKVEKDYIYIVENRLKAIYDGDGNSGNGNGNNKDNGGSGKSLLESIVDSFTGGEAEESAETTAEPTAISSTYARGNNETEPETPTTQTAARIRVESCSRRRERYLSWRS